jgi:hypothetical protein
VYTKQALATYADGGSYYNIRNISNIAYLKLVKKPQGVVVAVGTFEA